MPTTLAVVFDNPSAVYFTGQTITGYVQAVCDKPKKCRGIEVEFKGYGKVHWTERKTTGTGDDRKTETHHYTSQEKYYEMNYWVWGNGSDSYELPPGQHTFRFSFLVPNGIPSSFESHVGKVRHQCRAKMDIPWKIDKTCTRPYSINTLLDLNINPQAPMPIACTEEKYACCLWCRSGPMSLVLRIDRSGFVPGEKMIINAECTNMTRNEINHTRAKIEQITTYYAEGHTKKERRKVAEIKRGVIKPGKDDIWSGVEMAIPPLPPSNLEYCRIIDIDYEFQFEVEPSGCHTDLDFAVPIIIGSIPLQQYFSSFAPAVLPPSYPTPVAVPGVPVYPPQPGYPGEAPPAPGYPGQPAYNPSAPPAAGFVAGGMEPNPPPHNPALMPPPYPGSPTPTAPPVFPGIQQYPGMPLPEYNPCMFGMTKFSEHDSDDENQDHGFAPYYVSYSLVGSKKPPDVDMENAPVLCGAPSPGYNTGSDVDMENAPVLCGAPSPGYNTGSDVDMENAPVLCGAPSPGYNTGSEKDPLIIHHHNHRKSSSGSSSSSSSSEEGAHHHEERTGDHCSGGGGSGGEEEEQGREEKESSDEKEDGGEHEEKEEEECGDGDVGEKAEEGEKDGGKHEEVEEDGGEEEGGGDVGDECDDGGDEDCDDGGDEEE